MQLDQGKQAGDWVKARTEISCFPSPETHSPAPPNYHTIGRESPLPPDILRNQRQHLFPCDFLETTICSCQILKLISYFGQV